MQKCSSTVCKQRIRSQDAVPKESVTTAQRKHNKLLHDEAQSNVERPVSNGDAATAQKIGTYGFKVTGVAQLMIGVAGVRGEGRAAKVQVLIFESTSAITSALVDAIKPKKVGMDCMHIRAFAAQMIYAELKRYTLMLTGSSKNVTIWRERRHP